MAEPGQKEAEFDVFISFARVRPSSDARPSGPAEPRPGGLEDALDLRRVLADNYGIQAFVDQEDVKLGKRWNSVIDKALIGARVTVVVLGPGTSVSPHHRGEIQNVIEIATSDDSRRVVPWVRAGAPPVTGWPSGLREFQGSDLDVVGFAEKLAAHCGWPAVACPKAGGQLVLPENDVVAGQLGVGASGAAPRPGGDRHRAAGEAAVARARAGVRSMLSQPAAGQLLRVVRGAMEEHAGLPSGSDLEKVVDGLLDMYAHQFMVLVLDADRQARQLGAPGLAMLAGLESLWKELLPACWIYAPIDALDAVRRGRGGALVELDLTRAATLELALAARNKRPPRLMVVDGPAGDRVLGEGAVVVGPAEVGLLVLDSPERVRERATAAVASSLGINVPDVVERLVRRLGADVGGGTGMVLEELVMVIEERMNAERRAGRGRDRAVLLIDAEFGRYGGSAEADRVWSAVAKPIEAMFEQTQPWFIRLRGPRRREELTLESSIRELLRGAGEGA